MLRAWGGHSPVDSDAYETFIFLFERWRAWTVSKKLLHCSQMSLDWGKDLQEGNISTWFQSATQLLLWIRRIRFCWHFLHRFTCFEASVLRIRLGWSGRDVQRRRKGMGAVLTDTCHEPVPTPPSPIRQKQTSQVCLFKGSTWLFLSPNWRAKEIVCRGVTAV